jgi:hypothetical protein
MSKFLNNINLESGNDIQFKTTAGANAGKIEQDGNNLVLSNAVGDILLGDGSSDVYIGDGTNNVDILFEQSGSIKGDGSAVTLTIGGANTTLNLENPNINGTFSIGSTSINNKLTFTTANGYILFDHEPSGDTGAYDGTTSVPLLKIDRSGSEKTILERISQEGGILLGADDSVIIAAGDTRTVLRSNLNEAEETVVFASEAGFHAYGFPSNDNTWSNRNEFRFRSDSATASDNGLYIGDGTNVQFIDLSRNLKNIGTIGSGTITSTGHVAATEFRPTNIVTNKVVKFNGTQLDDANITDTGSLITLGSNTTLDGVLGVEVGNAFYSTPLLEITSSTTPTQIKIITNIPWSSTQAHAVTIRGFQYGDAQMADLQIGWHKYNNSFYNRAVTSSGSWAPVVRLAVENSKVVIHLAGPGYWPKLYVESLYNAFGGTDDATGWSWSDAAISADSGTPNETVPYKINFGASASVKVGSNNVFHDGYHPNADILTSSRYISLGGDLSGSAQFNGGSDITITAAVVNDSHTHTKLAGFSHQVEYDLIRAGNSNGLYMKARWDGSTSNRFWDMGYVDGNGTFSTGLRVINNGDITYKTNEMWHAGNDGTGSGLDADLLDAQEGSYYRNATNLNAGTVAADRLSTASTQPPNDNSTKIATTAYVQTELTDLIGAAPAALDTLSELADAINDDSTFSSTVTTALGNRLRVDTASQGLNSTQKSNARTNLGLGTAATSNTSAFLGATAKAADSNLLDGIDSSSFLRSDANDSATGTYIFSNTVYFGTNPSNAGRIEIADNSTTDYKLRILGTGTRAYELQGSGSSADYNTSFTNASTGGHNISVSGVISATGGNSTNWNTAYTDRNKWDGGSTGLTASTGRTSLGLGSAATQNTSAFAAASHNHDGRYYTEGEIDTIESDLYTAIGLKANLASPTFTGTVTTPNLSIGSGNKIKFANNDFIRYDDGNGVGRFHFDADGGTNNASVQAATFVGALSGNASTATTLATARTIVLSGDVTGSVSFNGSSNVSISTLTNKLRATDDRDVKPSTTGLSVSGVAAIKAYFTTFNGMTGSSGGAYQDMIALDTYSDSSGGGPSAITFNKSVAVGSPQMYIWKGAYNGTTWGTGQRVFADNYHPNADTLTTARTIAGTSFNGSANIDISYNNLTNKPTIPSLSGYATEAHVSSEISNLVNGAPAALDTLNELAAAIDDNASYASSITTALAGKLPLAGGTMTGQLICPSASTTRPVLTGGFLSRNDNGDGDHDVHGLSERYYPSNTTTADAWGLQWNGTNNQYRFIGAGNVRLSIDLDGGNTDLKWNNNSIFHAGYHPNADTLTTARTITLAGDVTGNVSFNGSSDVSITTVVGNDSHTHDSRYYTETETNGFLNLKANLNGATFTGTLNSRDIKLGSNYHLQRSNHHSGHLEGSYTNIGANEAKTNPIYTIGSAYNPNDDTLGSNMYGIGFSRETNASFLNFTGASGWGLYVAADGDARVFLDGSNGVVSSTGEHYVGSSKVFHDTYHPNADILTTTRNIALAGDVTGNVNFNGSGNVSITTALAANSVGSSEIATDAVGASEIAANAVRASELSVSGNGTTAQFLRSDGDGTFTWATPTDTNTVYTHPTHPGDDISIDTGALTGATVISDLDFNVTTDTSGHVTDANGTVATRTLTLANLGYTGATNANNYSLPEATATARGGIELFSNTDQSVAANSVSATSGRTYGIQLNSAGQAVVNVPWSDTNTDTNTTYSAGNGISLSSTTFSVAAGGGLTQTSTGLSHSDTSSQASVNNSSGTVIQDITLDTYGHITAISSANLDGRYYTETETNSFLNLKANLNGATFTGDLTVSKTSPLIRIYDSNTGSGSYPALEFDTANNQGVAIEFNEFDGELPAGGYGLIIKESSTNAQFPTTGTLSLSVLGEIYAGSTSIGSVNRVFHDGYHPNADTLTTARTINGVSFNGSSNITVADSTKLPLSGGTVTGDVTFNSNINVGERVTHNGDSNTWMGMTTDQINFYAGNVKMLTLQEGTHDQIVINENGGDVNFRIESDLESNAFYIDGAGNGSVGILTTTPTATLDVDGTIEHKVYTVSTLPSASPAGKRAFVSDAYYDLASSHGSTFPGGGSYTIPCYSDGSNWRAG